jgi:hypothetical protein
VKADPMEVELPLEFKRKFDEYKAEVAQATSESTKAFLFLEFVRKIFGSLNADYAERMMPELEKFVKVNQGTVIIRGRIDALLGNLIIEFERELDEYGKEEAEGQLKRYFAALWPRTNYYAVASDGLKINVYIPRAEVSPGVPITPDRVILESIEPVDLSEMDSRDAYLWLDRHLLSRELIPPRAEEFAKEFGIGSPTFQAAMVDLKEMWKDFGPKCLAMYNEWANYLSIAYGTDVESGDLFLRHTYLATLAKLMTYMFYSGGSAILSKKAIKNVLSGSAFKELGILNFLEEDFFAWVARDDRGVDLGKILVRQLSARYDMTKLTEDVLKELYQELVDPAARHDLGEYYTPDWLAQYIVNKLLDEGPKKNVLDPSCGSGTFLVSVINHKKAKSGLRGRKLLEHISESVAGIDIHPLAVIIARANFLMALGELVKERAGPISVPVYLADAIRLPEPEEETIGGLKTYTKTIDNKVKLYIPLMEEAAVDEAVEAVRDFADHIAKGEHASKESFAQYLTWRSPRLKSLLERGRIGSGAVLLLYQTSNSMAQLIKEGRDTFLAFVLRNFYKPSFLRGRFDVIVGNPPWLSYRYVENLEYQAFLKNLITAKYSLTKKAELMTHMELATLFFLATSELYLTRSGDIGFVMPRGVFTADHHDAFRRGEFTGIKLGIVSIEDLEHVQPLFNITSCVVFGRRGIKTTYPINGHVIKGKLYRKNATLEEAMKSLKLTKTDFVVSAIGDRSFITAGAKPTIGGGRSYYFDKFKQGATIVPRSLWFVDVKGGPKLGFSPQMPYVSTTSRAMERAKKGYAGVRLDGNVEKPFLYATLTGSEIVPFGHLPFLLVVLPAKPSRNKYVIIERPTAKGQGLEGLGEWLGKAEKVWKEKRGVKESKLTIYQRLNYARGLTDQDPSARFKVLYLTSGTNLASCIIDSNKKIEIEADGSRVSLQDFVAESTTYHSAAGSEEEANYLVSVLNSGIVNTKIKPMQAAGLFGERHIHKKVLEIAIPQYTPNDANHRRLAELGKHCSEKVEKILPPLTHYKSIAKIRSEIRKKLSDELQEIDSIISKML